MITVTIIAGVAVGSFGFQLLGVFSRPAEVGATVNNCLIQGHLETCSLTLLNSGASSVDATSCVVGGTHGSLVWGVVPAGGSLHTSCTVSASPVATDSSVTGWVVLSNGADAYFAGTVN